MTETDDTTTDGTDAADLRPRLHHLADQAAADVEVINPEEARRMARWGALVPVLAVGATLLLLAVGTAIVTLTGDDESAPEVATAGEDGGSSGPQVAVTFGTGGGSNPADLTLRYLDGDGNEIATRQWREVEETMPDIPDEMFAFRGVLQDVPTGDLTLEATLQLPGEDPQSCTQPFTMGDGDRLVVDLQPGPLGAAFDLAEGGRLVDDETHPPEITCGQLVPLADMIDGQTTPTGEAYLGLTLDEAEQRADEENLTVRLVGEDGMGLAATDDLQPDRLDVVLWDDHIVAAELPCENPLYDCEGAGGTTTHGGQAAVIHGSSGGDPIDLTLRFLDTEGDEDELAWRHWSEAENEASSPGTPMGILQDLPVGQFRIEASLLIAGETTECTQTVTIADGDRLVVDLQPGPIGTALDEAAGSTPAPEPDVECATVSPLEDELSETTPTGESYLGLTLAEAERQARDDDLTIRVVSEDGMSGILTADWVGTRLDVVLWDNEIVAAWLPCDDPAEAGEAPCDGGA